MITGCMQEWSSSLFGVLLNSFVIDTLHWRHFWLLLALPWVPLGGPSHEDHSDSNPIRQHRRGSDSVKGSAVKP